MSQHSGDTGRLATIYGLFDGEECFYVGVTARDTRVRMREHHSRARKGDDLPVYDILRSTPDAEIQQLALVPVASMYDAEEEWIKRLEPRANLITKWNWTPEIISRRNDSRREAGWSVNREKMQAVWEANRGSTGHWLGKKMADEHVAGFSGGRNGQAKLTDEQADEIRERYPGIGNYSRMALEYGVTASTIRRIVKMQTYVRRPGDSRKENA